jgi:hypothetical protein
VIDQGPLNESGGGIVFGLRQFLMDLADLPIGHVAFVLLAVGGLAWTHWGALSPGDYVGAIAAASGLLAVGHGIRHRPRR